MKVETQDLQDRQVQLTVEVPPERLQQALRSAARRLSKHTRISGFRPGKAPYEILVQRLGKEAVFEEALDSLGQEVYRSALEDAALEPYAPGTLEEVVSREPLVLRYTVPLAPEIDLGDYRDLRMPYEEPEVTDEAVTEVMEDLRQSQALIEPADREAKLSDVVVVDVHGSLEAAEGEEARSLVDEHEVSVLVDEDTDWPVPGVAEHLVGLKAGDEATFVYTFPDDAPAEDLRGRSASFTIACHEVKSRIVPEWTDEVAKNVGEYETLLDLRIDVRKQLQERAEQRARSEYADAALQKVVEGARIQYPPMLLEEEVDLLVRDLETRLRRENLALDDYLKVESKTEEDVRKELEAPAKDRLERALVLSEVVRAEDLDVDDEEIGAELDEMVAPLGEQAGELRKALSSDASRRRIAFDLLTRKAVDRLTAYARGEEVAAAEAKSQVSQSVESESRSEMQPEGEE